MRYVRGALYCLIGLALLPVAAWGLLRFACDDAGRGKLVAGILTRALPATFTIDAVGFTLPSTFDVRHATIDGPGGARVIEVDAVHTRVALPALLRGVVAFSDVVIESPTVRISQGPNDKRTDIEAAFQPPDLQGPAEGPLVRIEVEPITVRDAVVEVHMPDVAVRIDAIAVQDGHFWVNSTRLGATAQVRCAAQVKAPGVELNVKDVGVQVADASYRFVTDDQEVLAPDVHVQFAGFDGRGALQLAHTETSLGRFQSWFALQLDVPALAQALPQQKSALAPLRGSLDGFLVASGGAAEQHFTVDLRGENANAPRIEGVRVESVRADGRLNAASFLLDSLSMRILGAPVTASGTIALGPSTHPLARRHDISVATRGLPLRQLLLPWVKRPGLLPEQLTMSARSRGRSLWPMTSEVDIAVRATHTDAEILPGVTGRLIAEGKLLTHPDCVEFLALRTGSTHGVQVKLQGMVPLHPDGIADILRGLHTID